MHLKIFVMIFSNNLFFHTYYSTSIQEEKNYHLLDGQPTRVAKLKKDPINITINLEWLNYWGNAFM